MNGHTTKGAARPPIHVPSGIGGVYLAARREGKSHSEARDAAGHSSGHRGVALNNALARPRAEFERELAEAATADAGTPRATSSLTTPKETP